MIRTLALTAATTLTSVLLVGCGGGSDTDAYCDQLKDAKSNIEALDSGDIANFDAAIASIKEFA
ncbi:MAG: hypothetical protein F2667_12375, partial [Actinobacteria bacterium]|nr:hypothetical protein [Actinomycetota bacterium]